MRDVFEEIFAGEPADPMAAARRGAGPPLKRRFYTTVTVGAETDGQYAILLDGRPIRTPAGGLLACPNAALAEAVAAEWQAQEEFVHPARMPLTRLANTVIDGVAKAGAEVGEEIARYLASDLLFYRAEGPERLVARQAAHWDPVLAWAAETHGARFLLSQGVVYVRQTDEAIAAMRAQIPRDPWRLAAVNVATTLTGSALIALALAAGRLTVDEAWAAGQVDEDWNFDTWGRDEPAAARRARREAEMRAAALVLALA